MILTDGCRTMTKIHGGIGTNEFDKKPIKPIAMTTHKKMVGNSFDVFVDVLKQPIQYHSFAVDAEGYLKYFAWWKNLENHSIDNPQHMLTLPAYPIIEKITEKTMTKIQKIPAYQLAMIFQENIFAVKTNETREAKCPFDLLATYIAYYDQISDSLTDEFDFSEVVEISGVDSTFLYKMFLMQNENRNTDEFVVAKEGDFNKFLQELAIQFNDRAVEMLQMIGDQVADKRDYLHRLTGPEGREKFDFYFDMD